MMVFDDRGEQMYEHGAELQLLIRQEAVEVVWW